MVDGGTGFLRRFLPLLALCPSSLTFSLELIATGAELGNSLFREQFLESPLLDVLSLVLLELGDELHSSSEYAALVLLTARNDLCELIDTLIDGFSAAALD